jgi:Uma2 family endonuclease
VRVVWFIDSRQRTVQVYTAPDQLVTLTEKDTLGGGDVLPGFTLSVRELFAGMPAPKRARNGRKRK